jgi:hypothetical protein
MLRCAELMDARLKRGEQGIVLVLHLKTYNYGNIEDHRESPNRSRCYRPNGEGDPG